jgi:UDP-N-acetylmuramoylalanine--D-glutamate ligase
MSDRIVILGGGESGAGAAVLAKVQGFDVFVSDAGKIKDQYLETLKEWEIDYEEGAHSFNKILNASKIIKSPGIPEVVPVMQNVRASRIPVISETEFACAYTNAKIIAITGSNGKTTTTLLTHHILKSAGYNAGLAGNVGKSFAFEVATSSCDYYVLEISSFQLDDSYGFNPHIAVLLNITPDHLDRYSNSLEIYADSKFRITQNLKANQFFVYCADDPVIQRKLIEKTPAGLHIPFSLHERKSLNAAWVEENNLIVEINKHRYEMMIEQLALQGKHNLYDSMAAAITAKLVDVKNTVLRESLGDFTNVPHRLESVAMVHGIEFINDSKATNVNSAWYALESFNKQIIWIAGGQDKGNDYSELNKLVKDKVKALICLGADNTKLKKAFKGVTPIIHETKDIWEAVSMAYKIGAPGDVVLLSPACASFDLFENYEDRGNQFKQAVVNL